MDIFFLFLNLSDRGKEISLSTMQTVTAYALGVSVNMNVTSRGLAMRVL